MAILVILLLLVLLPLGFQYGNGMGGYNIPALQSQVSVDGKWLNGNASLINSLSSTIATDNTEVSSLQSLNNLSAIVNLQKSQTLESNHVVQMSSSTSSLAWAYQVVYSGYIVISYSSTQNVHYEFDANGVTMTSVSASSNSNIIFPIVGGHSYTVLLHNDSCGPASCNAVSVTETITYVY